MEPLDTTVFLHADKGFIKVVARRTDATAYTEVVISITDILSYEDITNNPGYSKLRSRTQDQEGRFYELIVKSSKSEIEKNIRLHTLDTSSSKEA